MSEFVFISRSELDGIVAQIVETTVAKIQPRISSVMTKKQLAAYLQKPVSTINRYMKEGMPYRKEGNEFPEFYRPAVDAWIKQRHEGVQYAS